MGILYRYKTNGVLSGERIYFLYFFSNVIFFREMYVWTISFLYDKGLPGLHQEAPNLKKTPDAISLC